MCLQIRPSFLTKSNVTMDENFKPPLDPGFNDTCPLGTVIIRRTRKEELIMAKELPKYFRNYGSRYGVLDSSGNNYVMQYAIMQSQKAKFHGFESSITTWALPNVGPDQSTASQVWMIGDVDGPDENLNVIQTGWHVSYLDIHSYMHACIYIFHDPELGHWWLSTADENLGYWPKEVLPSLDVAKAIDFGGVVYSPNNEGSPPMGSGYLAEEGIGKSSYFKSVTFRGDDQRAFTPGKDWARVVLNAPEKYYQIIAPIPDGGPWNVAYGGPGGLFNSSAV
ncbi:hypothetical protein ZIOFF_046041 [Zingiber officinale]|uniref:Neprosin PEP catalytic domain-containing protein n=1 Tax=Zingiber officinale TaxID=94328 RepID=A0A8J5KYX3_ZINOF|nr:hypothetical protein ZIOFF_046041 [Zingiber officinale]